MANEYSYQRDEIHDLVKLCNKNTKIDPALYAEYDVKRGLRDLNGRGVLTGLTEISDIKAYEVVGDREEPCRGKLFYRGYDIHDLVSGIVSDNRFGFEETAFLLIFGMLPNAEELKAFCNIISEFRKLPTNFVRDIIMKAPSHDMMNTLARSVLTLYAYDDMCDDISVENVLRQCLQLIALFPLFSVYGYQAYSHYHDGNSLYIHAPQPELSTAENFLYTLRPDSNYSALEAKILDVVLMLHAEHGGGNNSTFTTHVVTSSGTDTYSTVAAALASLKGPKHGGANIKVVRMFDDIKQNISDWTDENEIRTYLARMLHKDAFDKSGLIYGMGHAVYSISDPRAEILKDYVGRLCEEKGMQKEFMLYSLVEKIAPQVISAERKIYKGVSANVDFYSGLVYKTLNLPMELYTPLFAVSRISGWSAHRIEELVNEGKIIRPAYKYVGKHRKYKKISERK